MMNKFFLVLLVLFASATSFANTESADDENVPFGYCTYINDNGLPERIHLGTQDNSVGVYIGPEASKTLSPHVVEQFLIRNEKYTLAFMFSDYRLTILLGTERGQNDPPLAEVTGRFWAEISREGSSPALENRLNSLKSQELTFNYRAQNTLIRVTCSLEERYFSGGDLK